MDESKSAYEQLVFHVRNWWASKSDEIIEFPKIEPRLYAPTGAEIGCILFEACELILSCGWCSWPLDAKAYKEKDERIALCRFTQYKLSLWNSLEPV